MAVINVSEKIRDAIQSVFGNYFKRYLIGDSIILHQNDLPCLIVEKEKLEVDELSLGADMLIHTVRVKVVVNKKDDFSLQSENKVLWRQKLEDIVEKRTDTGGFDSQSICGILRKNITQDGTFYFQNMRVEYGVVPRPKELITEEAHIIITLKERVVVGSRS